MAVNISGIRRNLKNVAHNYTDAQVKVREATSNDPWGPSSTMMSEIADLTYNVVAFSEIMQMVWKRLNDHGRNWRHVYKALVLLEYLIKTGSEKVAQQCKENIFAIQTLKDFQYLDDNKDQGINVREKAKTLVALLKDDDRLKNERVRALKAKERFSQSTAAIGRDTVYNGRSDEQTSEARAVGGGSPSSFELAASYEMEAARPQTAGEEELQLQLALAMSREEHEQEETKSKSDDMRLQLALQKSTENNNHSKQQQQQQQHSKPSNDLLDINFGNPVVAPQQQPVPPQRTSASDPWGLPPSDCWGAATDPWSPPKTFDVVTTQNDPWRPVKEEDVSVSDNERRNSNDPWTPADDPFSPVAQGQLAEFDLIRDEVERVSPASGDLFDMGQMRRDLNGVKSNTGAKPKQNVQSLLSEHSNLVNLDDLVTTNTTSGKAPSVRNPFEQQPPNPFQAAKTPKPAMNELLHQKTSSGWTQQPPNQDMMMNPFF